MHIRETVSVAIDALRSNKLRATLTSLGVIIGSASIVLVVTVALTSKKFVISQIEGVGSNLVWAEMVHATGKAQPLSYEITMDDMNAMQGFARASWTLPARASCPCPSWSAAPSAR